MNLIIAKTREECENWKDVAVVIDVLRGATTICTLLNRSKKEIVLTEGETQAAAFLERHPEFESYSDFTLPGEGRHDNSPYEASRSSSGTPALVTTQTGTKAIFALRNASLVLLGGFCNFYTLVDVLKEIQKDILLVPGALFGSSDEVEDSLCVSALKDAVHGLGFAENAVTEVQTTLRYVEFLKNGPKTAEKDAKLAFAVNKIRLVPQVTFAPKENFAVCHLYNTPADPELLAINQRRPQAAAPVVAEPAAADSAVINDANARPPMLTVPEDEDLPKPRAASQPEKTSTGLKSFFKGFLKNVRDEKDDFERAMADSSGENTVPPLRPKGEEAADDWLDRKPSSDVHAEEPAPAVHMTSLEHTIVQNRDMAEDEVTRQQRRMAAPSGLKKAVVLFSGGLDSTTCLYWALDQGYQCEALTVSYGQRHEREVLSAEMITKNLGVKLHKIQLDLPWLGSVCSLVDKNKELPDIPVEDIPHAGVPSTYVPGRNLMFLSIAASLADAIGAQAIVAGPNAVDFSGYPDCTPAFFKAAGDAINRGTQLGVSEGIDVLAPLMRLSKADIVRLGDKLHVPFELTWSCYAGGKKPCGHCDSCKLRAKGFAEAGVRDKSLD